MIAATLEDLVERVLCNLLQLHDLDSLIVSPCQRPALASGILG